MHQDELPTPRPLLDHFEALGFNYCDRGEPVSSKADRSLLKDTQSWTDLLLNPNHGQCRPHGSVDQTCGNQQRDHAQANEDEIARQTKPFDNPHDPLA